MYCTVKYRSSTLFTCNFNFVLLFNQCSYSTADVCGSFLNPSGILEYMRWELTTLQMDEYEVISTSSLSVLLSLSEFGLNGYWLSAYVALLEWPVWYLIIKQNDVISLSCWIFNAHSLLLYIPVSYCPCTLATTSLINIMGFFSIMAHLMPAAVVWLSCNYALIFQMDVRISFYMQWHRFSVILFLG